MLAVNAELCRLRGRADPFDCQEFHELCMNYRAAQGLLADGTLQNEPQRCYEALQAYCRKHSQGAIK